uniref:NADH:ubiquinone reductase (H(+)-translocating) n=1 Tax=Trichuris sp. 2 ARS-2017 TaxID=2040584 RepID=A0A8F5HU02_9BILA|nr:NADH dehydrogenase subunit 5 [Trichuris sp. 2 ARS-2017]
MLMISYYLLFLMISFCCLMLMNGKLSIFTMSITWLNTNLSMEYFPDLMKYFSMAVILLSFFIIYFSFYYMNTDMPMQRFLFLMMSFITSMLIVNNSMSCWTMWLGWEGLGITSYLLIMYYNNWKSSNSAMTTILINRLGDFCLLISLMSFVYTMLWMLDDSNLIVFLIMMVMFASIAKSAQLPFHSWLPIAMAAPTPVSSLVHSSTLVVAGSILCLKLGSYFFTYSMFWLSLTGYLTSLYASIMAFFEVDIKKVLAYSTMSQIALVMFMLSCNLKDLMLMHIVNHALIKALLFMNFGIYIMNMFGNQDSRNFCMMNSMFWITTSIIGCLISMCGITFTSSYYSKEYSLLYSMKNENVFMLINLMIFMSFAYSSRIIYLLIYTTKSFNPKYQVFYPSLLMNCVLFPMMLMNGWMFITNYALPMNICWMSNKNYILLVPFIIMIYFFMQSYMKNSNYDIVYQLSNNMMILNKYFLGKMKSMSLSFNLNILTFMSFSSSLNILWPLLLIILTMIA